MDYIITDNAAIRKAICAPKSMPESWPFKPLKPLAMYRFLGDILPIELSVNDKFETGKDYPMYEHESQPFFIGNDGVGYKYVPAAWQYIKNL